MSEWTYESEDFDEELPFIELQFGIQDLQLLYKSVDVHYTKWSGGDIEEQQRLSYLKNFLYKVVLEYKFQME